MPFRRTALWLALACAFAAATAGTAAAADASRIPKSIGSQGKGRFLVSTVNLPPAVTLERFEEILRASGGRWGLRAGARTTREAGLADGHDIVGFTTDVPEEALAVQHDYVVREVRRRRVCSLKRRGKKRKRVCRVRRQVKDRVVERDITIRPDVQWQPGPALPGPEEFDLETVLVHELGHFAGNKEHVPRCSNSPLMDSLGPGEWWHNRADWKVEGCAGLARVAVAPARVVHRRVLLRSSR